MGSVRLWLCWDRCVWEVDLTVVGDARAAEVEFNELGAAQQTSPHHCVSHLGAGQPQHLQTREILDFFSPLKI